MKLTDMKPCPCCGGPLLHPPHGTFYVLRISQAIVSPKAVNQVLGLNQILGGHTALAEFFAPMADEAVVVMGDKEPELMTEVIICGECYMRQMGRLCEMVELVNRRKPA